MRIFFDAEFTDLGIESRLISIGLVSEDAAGQQIALKAELRRLAASAAER